ncbi:membrane-anchored protein YejM (alkaline phosphatase superfamily) [Catalinimonas alkaloidigena]|uniref:alkaline phosphatase family protein n=1 Tax=Catalinimonas alkaloidigena TaxID=1075417 RepID=UPI002406D979|nr:alkaline phosphatase family protein [Catalinimonas alkaloidigena]MDF9797153.1 membrane-anchored protein YejM (alkaline phosphatase superfamily) [Catalinimonas alkaloidigena]
MFLFKSPSLLFKRCKYALSVIFLLSFILFPAFAQKQNATENIILITLDGLRWQEVFRGADPLLIAHADYVSDSSELKTLFWKNAINERREALMPFFTKVIEKEGQLYGNRDANSKANLTNTYWFSYPGYNEILSGFGDQRIDSNDKKPNRNQTVLEYINQKERYKDKVAAFGSWDVFPYIINEARSGIPVNAGYENVEGNNLTELEKILNKLQPQLPGHWSTVRFDAFTHHYAMEYLQRAQPRVLYMAYGETDDFAHDGKYDEYLKAAHRTDMFIRQLWDFIQSTEQYKDKTTLIITTDHGRGTVPLDSWKSHGDDVKGSDEVWIAIMGPDTPVLSKEEIAGQYYTNQIAPTLAEFLKVNYQPAQKSGSPLSKAFKRNIRTGK